jgi:hypothetical protein
MNKQERIDKFIIDLGEFLEKYYSSAIDEVTLENKDGWLALKIAGPNDSILELWTLNAEVTVCFSESHWHIDDYRDPCHYPTIYEETIESVMDILGFKSGTYSCWTNGKERGGASFDESTTEEVVAAAQKHFKDCDEIRIKRWASELEIVRV